MGEAVGGLGTALWVPRLTLHPRLPRLGYSTPVSFGGFNHKRCLPSQRKQVLIAADQQIGPTAFG